MIRYSFNFNIALTPYGVCCVLFGAIHPHQNPNISSPPKGMGGIVRENEPASATESKKCYTGRNNLELLERKSGGKKSPVLCRRRGTHGKSFLRGLGGRLFGAMRLVASRQ